MSRTVFNPKAERGINSLSAFGRDLLVANCSVGSKDKNLWYYRINPEDWSLSFRDATMLQVDRTLPQVFNFDVIWGYYDQGPCWFSATEEGRLWMGTIAKDQRLSLLGSQAVTRNLGAALGMSVRGDLAVAAYDLYEFNTNPGKRLSEGEHPERFAAPEDGPERG